MAAANSCNYCQSKKAKLKCSRCKCAFYCNISCQKANWKKHKSQCIRKITFPHPLNIDMDKIKKEKFEFTTSHTLKELRQRFNYRVAYTSIKNTQREPSTAMLELYTDILLSPLTFWNVESIDIEFIPSYSKKILSSSAIRNFFRVTSKLPKLKRFYVQDQTGGEVYSETFNIRKCYIQSFQPGAYQSLTDLLIPIDNVFCESFDYSEFSSFIQNALTVNKIDIRIRYWRPEERDEMLFYRQCVLFNDATKQLLTCLSKRLSFEQLSFIIEDCKCVDNINEEYSDLLLGSLSKVIRSQHDLISLGLSGRAFSKPKQDEFCKGLTGRIDSLRELEFDNFELRPDADSCKNYDDLLNLIAAQKQMEFLCFDGYICWSVSSLKKFVSIINQNCKQIEFLRCGWIAFQAFEVENNWKMLMKLFENNNKMSLLYFQPWPFLQTNIDLQFDLFPDNVTNIISDAVIKCILNFNDFMVQSERIISRYIDGQKVVIQEIFNYLQDNDLKDQIAICISCPGGEYVSYKHKWSLQADKIQTFINKKIKQLKDEKQLTYVKTFDFNVY